MMVRPIAPAPIPYPSPLFARTGVSPLYAGAMAAGPAAGGGQPDWLSQLTTGLHNNSNALIGLGTGLLSSPTFAGGLAAGGQGWAQGNQADMAMMDRRKSDATTTANENQTRAWLAKNYPQYASLPTDQAWQLAMKDAGGSAAPADPANVAEYKFYAAQEQAAGNQPLSFEKWRAGSSKAPRAALGQPVPLKNRKTGEYVPFEPMSDGSMINTLTGEPANSTDWQFDPGMVASDKAAGSAYGTAQGGAQFNLPAAKQNIDAELANIDAIAADSAGLDQTFGNVGGVSVAGVGIPNQWMPTLPNSPKANLQTRISQVVGQNFLQAYASLKGAGAITETEGAKAQEAMARLSNAQSKDAFLQALGDLKTVLRTGYDRMSQQAAGGPYQSSGYTPAPIGNGATTDDLVNKYLGQ